MSATPMSLHTPLMAALNAEAERLWRACEPDWPGLSIEVRPELDSTNTALMTQGRQGVCDPTVLLALSQTAGRGRRGRTWMANPGQTLTFSVGLPMSLDRVPGGGSALSLAVGLALAEALDEPGSTRPPVGLKWPNDLWLGQRKLGGILIEATPAPGLSEHERWVVIGVGLNVCGTPPSPEAISLYPGDEPPHDALSNTFARVVPALLSAARTFQHTGFAPLQARFAQRDVLMGHDVQLWTHSEAPGLAGPDQQGPCLGVDAEGALLVHTAAGTQRWTAGDVSVRPPMASGPR